MRLNNQVWSKRALIQALVLLSTSTNWEQIGTATPEEAADTFAEAMQTLKFGDFMIGALVPYVTASEPEFTIPCDGSIYNRVDYPLLYAALDAAYIVDADTFTTPNLNGKTVIGADGTYAVNSTGGESSHALTEAELASHAHSLSGAATALAVAPGELPVLVPSILAGITGYTGSGNAHNNMQPYIALKWAIVAG